MRQKFEEKLSESKKKSREQDAKDLKSGLKSQDQLRQENGLFSFPGFKIHIKKFK